MGMPDEEQIDGRAQVMNCLIAKFKQGNTLYLLLVKDLGHKEVIVFLFQVVQSLFWTGFFFKFFDLHFVMIQFVIFWISVFED